jgi:FkbM family methyltransferase
MGTIAQRLVGAIREGRIGSGIKRRIRSVIDSPRRAYLSHCHGVIHIGANEGGERQDYAAHGLGVIWIEPIPEVFAKLVHNLQSFPHQQAIQALVTDRDGEPVTLHVSSNNGQSSSILDLALHCDIWPHVGYTHDIVLQSSTLPTLLAGEDLAKYDALVLDTQGSELTILKGAKSLLHRFRYVECEAADFEAYAGCATVSEITQFLKSQGFRLLRSDVMAAHPNGGKYFDLIFAATRR